MARQKRFQVLGEWLKKQSKHLWGDVGAKINNKAEAFPILEKPRWEKRKNAGGVNGIKFIEGVS